MRVRQLLFLLASDFLQPAHAGTKPPSDLVLVGAKVYTSPTAAPIENAVIVIRDGKIAEIGPDGRVKAPKGVPFIDMGGKVITAGFWNSHVHFTEAVWSGAGTAPAAKLEPHMQEMLTRWGFTTVFDIGSNPYDTLALRKRVDAGEIAGPKIYTTAGNILPENGIPVYVPKDIAGQLKQFEAATPADAARIAAAATGDGCRRHQALHRIDHGTREDHAHARQHCAGRGGSGACRRQAGLRASFESRGHRQRAGGRRGHSGAHHSYGRRIHAGRIGDDEGAAHGADSYSDAVGG